MAKAINLKGQADAYTRKHADALVEVVGLTAKGLRLVEKLAKGFLNGPLLLFAE